MMDYGLGHWELTPESKALQTYKFISNSHELTFAYKSTSLLK